ncbi:MAG: hypothetical protein SXV54_26650, partial [Chloroflexota bacterium]|nr:hypothetical protein [Chloroflexota bacterium]
DGRARVSKWLVKLEPPPNLVMIDATLEGGPETKAKAIEAPKVDSDTGEIIEAEIVPNNDGLTKAQLDAFEFVTPRGQRLGDCTPEQLQEMQDWVNQNPESQKALEIGRHISVLMNYMFEETNDTD